MVVDDTGPISRPPDVNAEHAVVSAMVVSFGRPP